MTDVMGKAVSEENTGEKNDRRLALAEMLNDMDDELLAEAARPRRNRKAVFMRTVLLAAVLGLLLACSGLALAVADLSRANSEFYLRALSPADLAVGENIELAFDGLKSDDMLTQYVAINSLLDAYNDPAERKRAVKALTPFLTDPEPKLAQAAAFVLDILQEKFENPYLDMAQGGSPKPYLARLSDGSIMFADFPEYSDYGSNNRLWRLSPDGDLSPYMSFGGAMDYIGGLLPSPDGKLLAVELNSYKSSFIVVVDVIEGYVSPELIDTARIRWGVLHDRPVQQRIDYENYSGYSDLRWLDNDTLAFDGYLGYNGAEFVDQVAVEYTYTHDNSDPTQGMVLTPLE